MMDFRCSFLVVKAEILLTVKPRLRSEIGISANPSPVCLEMPLLKDESEQFVVRAHEEMYGNAGKAVCQCQRFGDVHFQ